ncbi:bifunctional acetate--CoA ligase family protein/GNAT family N-acetyltransferase [Marinomonas epiphytica]
MSQHALQSLMAPQSIVVLTGDNPKDPIMLALVRNLLQGNLQRTLHVVGVEPTWPEDKRPEKSSSDIPNRVRHFSSLDQLTQPFDVAILAGFHQESMENIIAACGEARIHSLLMLSWTKETEQRLVPLLRKHNVRLLGPNSFGICRPKQGIFAWLGLTPPIPGRLALLSQSGTIASALVDWASWQGIGFSQVVTMGAPVDIQPSQILDYLSTDFESQAILMYLQHVGNATRFLSSLRATSRTKPVAVVAEHSIGANEKVLDAALRRTGAVRGRRLNDLVAAASVMTNARRIQEGALMIVGNGAGPGELAAQRATQLDVPLLEPNKQLHQELDHIIDHRGQVGPVTTVWASCESDVFVSLAETALKEPECSAVLLMLSPTALVDLSSFYEQIIELHKRQRKLLMVCLLGGGEMIAIRTRINEAGIPTFRTPESAIEGYQFLQQFQRNQRLAKQSPDSHAAHQTLEVDKARSWLQKAIQKHFLEAEKELIKDVFEVFNIRLSLRRQSTNLLQDPLHIRLYHDEVFGPVIALSVGQAWQDEVIGLPPLNSLLSEDLLTNLGVRGNHRPIIQLLTNISTLICELPELHSFQLSGLRLHESGSWSAELQATLKDCQQLRRYGHLAIQPYPRQWSSHLQLRSGLMTHVRPVHPEDAPIMADFVRSMSKETRYFRFISNLSELTPRMLANMSHIDYDREMAFMAVAQINGQETLIGTARYSDNFDDQSCEFAVVLADQIQGQGLASYLMQQLLLSAYDKGFKIMKGIVLAENKHMLQFCRRLGFSVIRDLDDLTQVVVSLSLTPDFISDIQADVKKRAQECT